MPRIKFLHGVSPSGEQFVIHPNPPACIGKVSVKDGKTRVYMEYKYADMTPEEEMAMCKDMKNWYYFSIEKNK